MTRKKRQDVLTRAMSHANINGPVHPILKTPCWIWLTGKSKGYGRMKVAGEMKGAHVVVYEMTRGPVPAGLYLDHLCRNRCCVNPDHLEPVTNAENVLRGEGPTAVNKRKTACKKGHPLDKANTYIRPDGNRTCKKCNLRSVAAYKNRKRDLVTAA